MASTRSTIAASADITISSAFQFGGQSNKKRKIITVTLVDSTANAEGWTIGGTNGDFLTSLMGFTNVDWVMSARAYTTLTGATTRCFNAAPSLTGSTQGILLTHTGTTAGAVGDVTLAATETLELVLVGY